MAQRVGLWTLRTLAQKLCKAIVQFTPLIRVAYPTNTTIITLLEAANAACAALVEEIQDIEPVGV